MRKIGDVAIGLFLGLAVGAISVAMLGGLLFPAPRVTLTETSVQTTTLTGPTTTLTEKHLLTETQLSTVTATATERLVSTETMSLTITRTATTPPGPTEELEAVIVHMYTIMTADGSEYIIWDRVSTRKYLYYRSRSHSLTFPEYVTYGDPDVIDLAEGIRDIYGGHGLKEIADTVLDVVQQLHYESDIDPYAKYPIETLCEGSGDCEDLSILYASLMKALVYDVVLLEYSDHMQVGVQLPEDLVPGGWYYSVDGKKYFICEATGEWITGHDWDVGECPEDYQAKSAKIHRIP